MFVLRSSIKASPFGGFTVFRETPDRQPQFSYVSPIWRLSSSLSVTMTKVGLPLSFRLIFSEKNIME